MTTMEHGHEHLTVYRDEANEWRWRYQAGNNRTLADSGEGYVSKDEAIEMAQRLFPSADVAILASE